MSSPRPPSHDPALDENVSQAEYHIAPDTETSAQPPSRSVSVNAPRSASAQYSEQKDDEQDNVFSLAQHTPENEILEGQFVRKLGHGSKLRLHFYPASLRAFNREIFRAAVAKNRRRDQVSRDACKLEFVRRRRLREH